LEVKKSISSELYLDFICNKYQKKIKNSGKCNETEKEIKTERKISIDRNPHGT